MTKRKTDAQRRAMPSFAAAVVAWLKTQPPGTQASTAQVAQGIGYTSKEGLNNMRNAMRRCPELRCTHTSSGRHGGKQAFWSLMEHEPLPVPKPTRVSDEDDDRELLPRRTSFPDIKPRPGMLFPGVYA